MQLLGLSGSLGRDGHQKHSKSGIKAPRLEIGLIRECLKTLAGVGGSNLEEDYDG